MSNVSIDPTRRRSDAPLDDAPPGLPPKPSPRDVRAAAASRLDAFVSSGGPDDHLGECPAVPNDPAAFSRFDLDKSKTDDVQGGVLLRAQAGDVDAISPRDIQQGPMGDCHFLAALSALASTPAGKAMIRDNVTENKDASGHVVSYKVTLYKQETHLWGPPTFEPIKITVQGPFACTHAGTKSEDGGPPEMWPMVYEAAYAQLRGGYNAIGHDGAAADAMTALTGKPAHVIPIDPSGVDAMATIRRALGAGQMVCLNSPANGGKDLPNGVVDYHLFSVVGTFLKRGKEYVVLRNPWGFKDPNPIPMDELSKSFRGVIVGDVQ